MVVTESIEIEVEFNESKFKSSLKKTASFAEKEVERLNSKLGIQLTARAVGLKKELDDIKKRIKIAEASDDFELSMRLKIDEKRLKKQLQTANKEFKNFAERGDKSISGVQKRFNQLGSSVKSLVKTLGLLFIFRKITQAITGASKAAIEFESAFAGVRKTLDGTEAEFKVIEKGLINLSKQIPVTVKDLSKIAEIGGQLGVAKEDILSFTETVAKIGVTTNLSVEEAATSFARIAEVTGEPLANIDRMASSVVELGNNFATTEKEIVNFANRISGAGSLVGLTTADIFGIGAAFTAVGIEAESGGTAVQKALLKINAAVINGGKELDKFAALTGKSSEEFQKSWREDAGGAFVEFVEALGDSGDDSLKILQNLLGSDIRLTRAFLTAANAGDLLREAVESSNREFEENNALQEEADKRFKTSESRLIVANNKWKAFGNTMGTVLNKFFIPAFERITDFFTFELGQGIGVASAALRDFFVIAVPTLFKNLLIRARNLGENLGIAIGASAKFAVGGLNTLISLIEKAVNKGIGILNKIPGVDITPVSFEGLGEQTIREFKDINDGVIDLREEMQKGLTKIAIKQFNEEKKAREGFKEDRKRAIKEEIQEEAKRLDELLKLLGGDKEAAKSALKEEKRALQQSNNFREFLADKQKKRDDERLKRTKEQFKTTTDFLDKEIKGQEELIDNLEKAADKVGDIDKKLSQLGTERETSVAGRAVEIENRIKQLREERNAGKASEDSLEEQKKLEKELKLAKENTTKEAINEARRIEGLNPVELILEEVEAEKLKLEAKKEAIAEELGLEIGKEQELSEVIATERAAQEEVLKQFQATRIALEEAFTVALGEESQKQAEFYDKNIVKLKKIIELQRQAGLSRASDINTGSNGSTDNSTNTSSVSIKIDANVNNQQDIRNLADEIGKIFVKQKKNGNKNIL